MAAARSLKPTQEDRLAHETSLEFSGLSDNESSLFGEGTNGWELNRLPRMPDQLMRDASSRTSHTWLRKP